MIGCSYIQLLPIDVSRAAKPVSVADSDVRSGSRRCPLGKKYRGKSATTYVIRVWREHPAPGRGGRGIELLEESAYAVRHLVYRSCSLSFKVLLSDEAFTLVCPLGSASRLVDVG